MSAGFEGYESDEASDGQFLSFDVGGGQCAAFTRQGPGKDTGNEDTVGIFPYGPGGAVMAVADGAGGLPAGQRASRTAIATLRRVLHEAEDETRLLRTAILNGIEAANEGNHRARQRLGDDTDGRNRRGYDGANLSRGRFHRARYRSARQAEAADGRAFPGGVCRRGGFPQ